MDLVAGRADRVRSYFCAFVASIPLLIAACGAPDGEPVAEIAEPSTQASSLDVRKSLLVTDLPTLSARDASGAPRFSLKRVLDRMAATSGMPTSALDLYRRLFDTNNTKAGGFVADGQHCDDQKDNHGTPVINGFPIECPRQEGALADTAHHHPFCEGPTCDPYTPIALVNRFDLADPGGRTCGQLRMVFAKGMHDAPLTTAGNPLPFNRVLIIFESVIENPHPEKGLKGCGGLMEAWGKLSATREAADRAAALDRIFFSGVPGFSPAVAYTRFTGALDPVSHVQVSGQIRVNQFMNDLGGQMWQLREYHAARSCEGPGSQRACKARIRMDVALVNPAATLFDDANTSTAALAFRSPNNPVGFLKQVAALAAPDLNRINMDPLGRAFNSAESTSSPTFGGPPVDETNYTASFNPSGPFAAAIQAELNKIGSPLQPIHIVRRAQTQSCAGCHELSTSTAAFFGGPADGNQLGGGLTWPDTAPGQDLDPGPDVLRLNAFTQISDALLLPLSPVATCDMACTAHPTSCACTWAVSPALSDVFLPFRKAQLEQFLASLP